MIAYMKHSHLSIITIMLKYLLTFLKFSRERLHTKNGKESEFYMVGCVAYRFYRETKENFSPFSYI